jgi:hypothetical protein
VLVVKKTKRCLVGLHLSDDERWQEFARQIRSADPTFIKLAGSEIDRGMHSKLPPRKWVDVEYYAAHQR